MIDRHALQYHAPQLAIIKFPQLAHAQPISLETPVDMDNASQGIHQPTAQTYHSIEIVAIDHLDMS
jgi:hypothetical protein